VIKRILSIIIVFSSNLFSYTYLGYDNFGDDVEGISARAISMGGTSISNSQISESIFYNPANTVWAEKKEVGFGFSLFLPGERVIPDNDWSSETGGGYYNFQNIFQFDYFSFVYPKDNISFSIGYFPLYDLNYKNGVDIYTNSNLVGRWELKSKGNIYAYVPSLSFRIKDYFSFGFGYLIGDGKANFDERTVSYSTNTVIQTVNASGKFSGDAFNFSVMYRRENYSISFVYRDKIKTKFNAKSGGSTYESEFIYPTIYGVGFSYTYSGINEATFSVEVIRKSWSDSKYKLIKINETQYNIESNPNYPDVTEVHIGVEHFVGEILLRYGIEFIPTYFSKAYQRVDFAFGTGFNIFENFGIDVGFLYGKMNYIGEYEFATTEYDWRTDLIFRRLILSCIWRF